ncbi:MAG TPA: EthD domain-containing protein [Rhizomicrobium sp.]|nr:EthD domain-containing protein [Rhizomicrobium sp.]
MIKLTFCLHRLPSLSRDAFQSYWREQHAPLVARHAKVLRIRRYVQTHALTVPFNDAIRASREAPEMYDGVAELWWDSLEDLMASGQSEDARAAGLELLEDERKFIDLPRSPLWLGEERTILGH